MIDGSIAYQTAVDVQNSKGEGRIIFNMEKEHYMIVFHNKRNRRLVDAAKEIKISVFFYSTFMKISETLNKLIKQDIALNDLFTQMKINIL